MFDELFDLLRDPDFQNPDSGRMNFPAYLYAYPAEEEYRFRRNLSTLSDRLARPPHKQVPYIVNVFDRLIEQLRKTTYGEDTYLDIVREEEQKHPKKTKRLFQEVLSDDGQFYEAIHDDIRAHQAEAGSRETRSYVFIHGWGSIHPYLRASQFMGCMERYVDGYKLILFYPGSWENGRLQFLGRVDGRGPYRAQPLNDQIGTGVNE
jgi:hypothetical protein